MLRPGTETIALHRGALHGFMGWERPILTDSGDFRSSSLASLRKIDEDGVRFRSPVDGSSVHMRPEDAMDVQRAWARISPWHSTTARPTRPRKPTRANRCSARCAGPARPRSLLSQIRVGGAPPGHLFAIVQGGMYESLRPGIHRNPRTA